VPHPYRDPALPPRPAPDRDREWPAEDLALAAVLGPLGVAIAMFGQGPTELALATILIGLAGSVLRDAYRVCSRRLPSPPRRTP
jgi:hypothetical protein